MEKYNEENDANIELVYGENNFEVINTMLANGSIDAYVNTARTVALNNKEYNTDHKVVGDAIMESETYYLFNKSNTTLQTAVDGALKELKDSGKMAELCVEWLGEDFTPED
jgi:ABC-type amino acid transport substrate-binding protein